MLEQCTLSGELAIGPEAVYEKIRPYIDEMLDRLNFSPAHIALSSIAGGISLRYNLSSSIFSAKAAQAEGSRVLLRIVEDTAGTAVEIPQGRTDFYTSKGLVLVQTKAANPLLRKISIDQSLLPSLIKGIEEDIFNYFVAYPSYFGCCSLNEQCSNAHRCVQPDQDMAASCYYKKNLMRGITYYGASASPEGETVQTIPPEEGEWQEFANAADRAQYYELWGFKPDTSLIFYAGHNADTVIPCEVVGHKDAYTAVISIKGALHCIRGEHLREMQPKRSRSSGLPSEYVVIDTETTSVIPKYAEIIEIAAIKYKDGVQCGTFSSLIKPKRKIPAKATAVNGITNEDVACAPSWDAIADDFFNFIGDTTIVGHNVRYDLDVLRYRSKRWIGNPYIDTLKLARKAFPEYKSHKLEYLKKVILHNDRPSHRALEDCETTNAILLAMQVRE